MKNQIFDKQGLSKRIRDLRAKNGLSLDQFAKSIGFSSSESPWKWERGEAIPSLKAVVAICNRFGIGVDELVFGTIK